MQVDVEAMKIGREVPLSDPAELKAKEAEVSIGFYSPGGFRNCGCLGYSRVPGSVLVSDYVRNSGCTSVCYRVHVGCNRTAVTFIALCARLRIGVSAGIVVGNLNSVSIRTNFRLSIGLELFYFGSWVLNDDWFRIGLAVRTGLNFRSSVGVSVRTAVRCRVGAKVTIYARFGIGIRALIGDRAGNGCYWYLLAMCCSINLLKGVIVPKRRV